MMKRPVQLGQYEKMMMAAESVSAMHSNEAACILCRYSLDLDHQ